MARLGLTEVSGALRVTIKSERSVLQTLVKRRFGVHSRRMKLHHDSACVSDLLDQTPDWLCHSVNGTRADSLVYHQHSACRSIPCFHAGCHFYFINYFNCIARKFDKIVIIPIANNMRFGGQIICLIHHHFTTGAIEFYCLVSLWVAAFIGAATQTLLLDFFKFWPWQIRAQTDACLAFSHHQPTGVC